MNELESNIYHECLALQHHGLAPVRIKENPKHISVLMGDAGFKLREFNIDKQDLMNASSALKPSASEAGGSNIGSWVGDIINPSLFGRGGHVFVNLIVKELNKLGFKKDV